MEQQEGSGYHIKDYTWAFSMDNSFCLLGEDNTSIIEVYAANKKKQSKAKSLGKRLLQ